MELNAELARAKQAFEDLTSLREFSAADSWSPADEQEDLYVRNGDSVLNALDRLAAAESRRLSEDAELHSVVPENLLAFVREVIRPNEHASEMCSTSWIQRASCSGWSSFGLSELVGQD